MSLIAWYPLNGDTLDYSGNGNHLQYGYNSGKLINNDNGKIGKCYERAATNNGADYLYGKEQINLQGDFTMACWAYVTGCHASTANGLVTNHSHSHNTGAGITVKYVSSTDFRISCNTGSGTGRTYHSYYGTTNIKDKWSHLVVRYEKKTNNLSLWVNGAKEYEKTYAMAYKLDTLALFAWSTTYLSNVSYRPQSKLNDVRIYDHALSTKEIKELYKTKVLHYTFDDFQEPTENLLPEGVMEKTGTREYLMYTNLSPIFDAHGVGTYTFSFDIKTPVPGSISVYCNDRAANTIEYNYSSMGIYVTEDYQRFTMTRDITLANADATHTSLAFYGTYDSGRIPTVRNVQIEKKDHATPFTPDTREGVVRDISGYGNDAVLGLSTSPQWVNESKIGGGAYKFKTGNSIKANILLEPKIEEEYSYGQLLGLGLLGI